MKKHFWIKSLSLLFLLFTHIFASAENCPKLHFVFVTAPGAQGDKAQCEGIFNHFNKLNKSLLKTYYNTDSNHLTLNSLYKQGYCNVLIVTSSFGLNVLNKIITNSNFEKEKWVIVSLSHMYFDMHTKLAKNIDFLFLPQHEIQEVDQTFKGKIFPTNGVMHTTTKVNLEEEFKKNSSNISLTKLSKQAGPFVLFMLGGDAISSDGSIQNFTKEQALESLKKTAQTWPNAHIILVNGPRTGKYDPSTKREIKYGESIDDVSFAALSWLKKHRKDRYTFEPFKKNHPSLLKSLLWFIIQHNGKLVLPGESVSLLSEAKAVMPHDHIYVYTHDAVNKSHQRFITIGIEEGWLAYIGEKHTQTRHWKGYLPVSKWLEKIIKKCRVKKVSF